MSGQKPSLYLERRTYRQRRRMDAARLLPLLGVVLFLMPLLWATGGGAATARGGMYIFAIWAGLIVVAAWLSRWLVGRQADKQSGEPPK